MHRNYVPLVICVTASAVLGFAADISTDTKAALADEWKQSTGFRHCLRALQVYTMPTKSLKRPKEFMPPDEIAEFSLSELLNGTPANKDLYTAAQGRSDFLTMLATANQLNIDKAGEASFFSSKVSPLIESIYRGSPTGKTDLVKIQSSFGRKDIHLALYQLLNASLELNKPAVNDTLADLEILRAAFELNSETLASLVAAKNPPAK